MRQIETTTAVILKMLMNKDVFSRAEAEENLNGACKGILGVDYGFIKSLPVETVSAMLSFNADIDINKFFAVAKLFELDSMITEDEASKNNLKEKSIYFYNIVLSEMETLAIDNVEMKQEIIKSLTSLSEAQSN
ncbi:MAG TPA: hypothetical protein VHP32_02790 [Ignavibacteria bacterium]|nr:hypothetical protein [Ignavibacteria bacterium]